MQSNNASDFLKHFPGELLSTSSFHANTAAAKKKKQQTKKLDYRVQDISHNVP